MQLLVAKTEVPHRVQGGFVEVEVPSVELHEVIAFDLQA